LVLFLAESQPLILPLGNPSDWSDYIAFCIVELRFALYVYEFWEVGFEMTQSDARMPLFGPRRFHHPHHKGSSNLYRFSLGGRRFYLLFLKELVYHLQDDPVVDA